MKDFKNILTVGTKLEHSAPHKPEYNPYRVLGIGRMVIGIGTEEHVIESPFTVNIGGENISIDPVLVAYSGRYYSDTYGPGATWIRPLNNMFEDIGTEGIVKPRFQIIGQDS